MLDLLIHNYNHKKNVEIKCNNLFFFFLVD